MASRTFPESTDELNDVLARHQYQMVKRIGNGSCGIVYLVNSLKYNELFAMKTIFNTPELVRDHDEVKALCQLCNPGIIHLYEFDIQADYTYLFLEYCSGGSVRKFLRENGPVKGELMKPIALFLLQSLDYIHCHKVTHRDIKPENLLIDSYGRMKYADFGLSNLHERNRKFTEKVGSIPYMSPELLQDHYFDPIAADIWALGMTLFVMHVGHFPFPLSNDNDIKNSIRGLKINFPPFFDPSLQSLLKYMLCPINVRASVKTLLANSLFKNVDIKDAKLISCTDKKKIPVMKTNSFNVPIPLIKTRAFKVSTNNLLITPRVRTMTPVRKVANVNLRRLMDVSE